jgi:transcriptional regulatory protein LEU3
VLASCTILKIHRSELAPHLDLEAGEQAYFASIVFAREGSIQNNDLSARGASIFSQLWNSQKIFKGKDGKIDSLSSRISSRLSTSVVFDCLWWWRQEFGGSGTCTAQVTSSMANNNGVSFEQREAGSSDALELQQTAPLTDEPFVDFDWDISLNLNEWPL